MTGCPFPHDSLASLPTDGTPLHPSSRLTQWREDGAASALDFTDGHRGLVATGYDLARAVLEDPRFSMSPGRVPVADTQPGGVAVAHGEEVIPGFAAPELDAAAQRSQSASLLGTDGERHLRLRRSVTSRFSVKQARMRRPQVAENVARMLAVFRAAEGQHDVWKQFAQPIAALTHCQVLGVPEAHHERWVRLFVGEATDQERYDYIRELLAVREGDPGDDVVTDLLATEAVTREEVEGLLFMLMLSGRDSVAYLITTALVGLLTNPTQLAVLQADPSLVSPAIEEFMRSGAMFLTLFPRTATEDVEVAGVAIAAGTTVSVSPVGANRDPAHWSDPDEFDVSRDAFGHLGFGHGIHGCIGQQLARVEIDEAVTALITQLPGLHLVEAEQLQPMPFAHPVATYEAGRTLVAWD